jgi:hypothetical protein
MKKLATLTVLLSFLLALAAFRVSWADPWAVVANHDDLTIHTIDLGMDPPDVYGPFLEGELGTSGPLLDVAVTPDGHYALVSNSGSNTVYRIDLSDPANPALDDFLPIGFKAQDIDIASSGEFALVVDGPGGNQIAIIDLDPFALITTYELTTEDASAEAVAIAPDNQTVILCDEFYNRIIYGELDPANLDDGLTSENELPTGVGPTNVSISPDGKTVLVANGTGGSVSVFQITNPSSIQDRGIVSGLPGGEQSIAFSPDGERAYVVSSGMFATDPDLLSWLRVNEPGVVELGRAEVVELPSNMGGFLGVDVLAITPDGSHALVGNPGSIGIPIQSVTMVDLSNWEWEEWEWTEINTKGDFPVGIAVFNQFQPSLVPVYVDIKPGRCPNPLYLKSREFLPVAVLGTEDFEVTDIDPTTIRLTREAVLGIKTKLSEVTDIDAAAIGLSREENGGGVVPIRWHYKDVSTPFEGEPCECHKLGPDGYEDLILEFRNQEVVEALGALKVGEAVVLTIRGKLLDGTEFEGIDCVTVTACFIRTVAYESRMAKDVDVLRKVRDRYLSKNYLGRALVSSYYRHGPKLATFVSKHPLLKSIVRVGLYPWVRAGRLVIE